MTNPVQFPKILLVAPTSNSLLQRVSLSSVAPHYGLSLLCAALLKEGVEATVLDEFSFQNSPLYSGVRGWEQALETALNAYPSLRLIGFSMLTNFRREVASLSRLARNMRSELLIAWGGPHVTALGPSLLTRYQDLCDLMVSGPADDRVIASLINMVADNHRRSSAVFLRGNWTKDIARFTLPDYSSLQTNKQQRIPRLIIRTSSGCPTPTCIFCSAILEGSYSPKQIAHVADQVRDAIALRPVRLEFHDQDLFFNKNRFRAILSETTLEGVETVYCHSGIDSFSEEHIQLIDETVPKWEVFVGLESASEHIYRLLCKRRMGQQSLDRFTEYVSKAQHHRIRFGIFVLVGVPGEQIEDYELTRAYLHQLGDIDLNIGLMKVFPGTHLEQQLIQAGQLDPGLWLDENGPRVVSAVKGDALEMACDQWRHLLDSFPVGKKHNQIDQELFQLNGQEPENN